MLIKINNLPNNIYTEMLNVITEYKKYLIFPSYPNYLIPKGILKKNWFILTIDNKIKALASIKDNSYEIMLSLEKSWYTSIFHAFLLKELVDRYEIVIAEMFKYNPNLKIVEKSIEKFTTIYYQYKHFDNIQNDFSMFPFYDNKTGIEFDGFCLYIPYSKKQQVKEILKKYPWSEVAFYSFSPIKDNDIIEAIHFQFPPSKILKFSKEIEKFKKILMKNPNINILYYDPL